MDEASRNGRLRNLPSIDELASRPAVSARLSRLRPELRTQILRAAVSAARTRILRGDERGFSEDDLDVEFAKRSRRHLRPVHNATGVILHTSLGRAPLAARAIERLSTTASGYCNLEVDLASGARDDRGDCVEPLLRELTGAEAALVVNNGAAAVLLVLSALASGREILVSRGELIEIGGGFRIPDVMSLAGGRLREVGTTNRTHPSDFEAAMGPDTALITKVHRSNFAMVGFTTEATIEELSALASRSNVPLYVDLGSGALDAVAVEGGEFGPTVGAVIARGADMVSFSGDKLLGGPQAGIVIGRAKLVERLRRHPFMRAMRVDKLTLAALEATLELHAEGRQSEIPVQATLLATSEMLETRARRLQSLLAARGVTGRVTASVAKVGGGAMPLAELPSYCVDVETSSPAAHHQALRMGRPSVMAYLAEGALRLDVRCLTNSELESVADCTAIVLRGESGC
jgi:L-seryl-tRNA(Ser) seleniumtransferase